MIDFFDNRAEEAISIPQRRKKKKNRQFYDMKLLSNTLHRMRFDDKAEEEKKNLLGSFWWTFILQPFVKRQGKRDKIDSKDWIQRGRDGETL